MHFNHDGDDSNRNIEPKVLLWYIENVYLIVEWEGGVQYENQTSGLDTLPRVQKGVLAPLEISEEKMDLIVGLPWPASGTGITSEMADQLDVIFTSDTSMSYLSVDRERLNESAEAWVYVRLGAMPAVKPLRVSGYLGPVYGLTGHRGVITWPNSD